MALTADRHNCNERFYAPLPVTSFGLSPNCAGFDGAYRIDQPDDLQFIGQFLP